VANFTKLLRTAGSCPFSSNSTILYSLSGSPSSTFVKLAVCLIDNLEVMLPICRAIRTRFCKKASL
jgi:hypothetical protein